MYHSNYFVWFEIARTELIRSIGVSYKQIEEAGLLLPVVDVSCQYKSSALYDDELAVYVKVERYTGLRLDFYYEVKNNSNDKLLASGKTKHVFVDSEQKPKRLDKSAYEIHKNKTIARRIWRKQCIEYLLY